MRFTVGDTQGNSLGRQLGGQFLVEEHPELLNVCDDREYSCPTAATHPFNSRCSKPLIVSEVSSAAAK